VWEPGPKLFRQPSTLDPQPSTLNPSPSTPHPQPCNLHPQPSSLIHPTSTLQPQYSNLNPPTSTLQSQPFTPNPQFQPPTKKNRKNAKLKTQTPNPSCSGTTRSLSSDARWLRALTSRCLMTPRFKNNCFAETRSGSEQGS
jgi:hypothetical protein